ncbi:MAG: hypothetical protein WA231_20870 [Methylocella sp.]
MNQDEAAARNISPFFTRKSLAFDSGEHQKKRHEPPLLQVALAGEAQ